MKVTVGIKAYKHEQFVAAAIESVLAQKTDFHFEILIGEDFSPDRTREIVKEFARSYPDRIRLFLPPENIGRHRIVEALCKQAKGRYLAILDGDDFWTDPLKLQKQADFFDAHPDCNVCFTNATMREEGKPDILFARKPSKPIYSLDEYLAGDIHIVTSSVMYRLREGLRFPEWFFRMGMADVPMHVLYAEGGTLGFVNEDTTVYRVHSGGLWSTPGGWTDEIQVNRTRTLIEIWHVLQNHLGVQYQRAIQKRLAEAWYDIAWRLQCLGRIREMRDALHQARRSGPIPAIVSKAFVAKAYVIAFVPGFAKAWHAMHKGRALK